MRRPPHPAPSREPPGSTRHRYPARRSPHPRPAQIPSSNRPGPAPSADDRGPVPRSAAAVGSLSSQWLLQRNRRRQEAVCLPFRHRPGMSEWGPGRPKRRRRTPSRRQEVPERGRQGGVPIPLSPDRRRPESPRPRLQSVGARAGAAPPSARHPRHPRRRAHPDPRIRRQPGRREPESSNPPSSQGRSPAALHPSPSGRRAPCPPAFWSEPADWRRPL